MTAPLADTVADLQATIAALRQELAERTAELAARNNAFSELASHQAATTGVLKVMAASPGDPQPVFDLIVRQATELCSVPTATLFEYDGELVHWRSLYQIETVVASSVLEDYLDRFPMAPVRGSVSCRAILESQTIHVRDMRAEPELAAFVRELGHRSQASVPLMREGRAIGVISIGAQEPGGFTDSQIELLTTFAEQAVIAITSAEAYRALHEALEQQTATAEVLQVINASPGNLAPVFAAVLDKAIQLSQSEFGVFNAYDGECFHAVPSRGVDPRLVEYLRAPIRTRPGLALYRMVQGEDVVHIADITDDDAYRSGDAGRRAVADLGGARSQLMAALRKDGKLLGAINIYRQEVRPFTDAQIALVRSFAAQAVIAMENARLLTEQREALAEQTATAEVLQVINASPGRLEPVFDAIIGKAMHLCQAEFGGLTTYDGDAFHLYEEFSGWKPEPIVPDPGSALAQLLGGSAFVHVPDVVDTEAYRTRVPARVRLVEEFGARTTLWMALRKDDALLGTLTIYRREVRPFTDRHIALLANFAAQAVIAMENARLMAEQREALERQTATAEMLQVINASPGNLTPVFDTILDKAHALCGAMLGSLMIYDGVHAHAAAIHGFPESHAALVRQPWRPAGSLQSLIDGARLIHVLDQKFADVHPDENITRNALESRDIRTALWVPLRKDATLLGWISAFRVEVRPFSDKEIALLESFASQAVIAMENARLLNEIRQRQEELRVTFENMGDGVALFDETRHLVASNRRFQDMLDVPDEVIASRPAFADYIQYLADRGEYGPDPAAHVARLLAFGGQPTAFERTRPDGRVIEVRGNPVPGGGFVVIYSDITERKRSEAELRAARDAAEQASRTIEAAYRELKAAQASLIQAEKMASLGQLTAGIAHEIKNPLNFVNNFASLSVGLLHELTETAAPGFASLDTGTRREVDELAAMLTGNLQKIEEHGRRADGIVRSMLEHSRGSSGERRLVDLNMLVDEALNLAYHGARAQDSGFDITLHRDFAHGIAPIELAPQDITRVLLNLCSNGFYATGRRVAGGRGADYQPTLKVATRDLGDAVEIRVRDNGIGIPPEVRDKLFQPFFTTKPTGEGTGLGLSISYEVVAQQHGGSIAADSRVGEYSEFIIRLPRLLEPHDPPMRIVHRVEE
jgi:signal transduction histidine kinase/putative methionine-R-sulfoxide reductase with GAF domain